MKNYKYKGVLLCRVSTKKQELEGNSLERQEKRGKNFANDKDIKLLSIFKETFSGKIENRETTEQAIKFAIENKVNYLIIPEIDRFTRGGYVVYSNMKKRLEKHKIKLLDTNHIIQESTIVYENEHLDMSQYKWNKDDASIYAEVMIATQAEIEGRKILQRMIPKEIELEQEGYQVRAPRYGFKNKKIKTSKGNRVIQVPNPPFFGWLLEMFEGRAKGILSDQEIIDILNAKGAVKKSGKPLDVKYMLEVISNPIYAGVIKSKWTGNKPIPTAYDMLPIDLWNQANRGRFFISRNGDNIVIEKNIDIRKKLPQDIKESFVFRGIIRYEGYAMTPYIKKGNVYYRSGRLVKPAFNISEKKLLDIFGELIESYSITEDNRKYIEKFASEFINNELKESKKKVETLEKEIKRVHEENKDLVRKNLKGLISDAMMSEIVNDNEETLEKTKALLIKEKNKSTLDAKSVCELSFFLLNTKELWKKANHYQKKELVRMIVSELSINNKKEFKIAETKLFKLLLNLNLLKWYPNSIEITNFLNYIIVNYTYLKNNIIVFKNLQSRV